MSARPVRGAGRVTRPGRRPALTQCRIAASGRPGLGIVSVGRRAEHPGRRFRAAYGFHSSSLLLLAMPQPRPGARDDLPRAGDHAPVQILGCDERRQVWLACRDGEPSLLWVHAFDDAYRAAQVSRGVKLAVPAAIQIRSGGVGSLATSGIVLHAARQHGATRPSIRRAPVFPGAAVSPCVADKPVNPAKPAQTGSG